MLDGVREVLLPQGKVRAARAALQTSEEALALYWRSARGDQGTAAQRA